MFLFACSGGRLELLRSSEDQSGFLDSYIYVVVLLKGLLSRGKSQEENRTFPEILWSKLSKMKLLFFLDFTIQPATRVFLANTYQDLNNVVFTSG